MYCYGKRSLASLPASTRNSLLDSQSESLPSWCFALNPGLAASLCLSGRFCQELVDGVHPARIFAGEVPASGSALSEIILAEGAFPPGRAWCDVVLSESEVDMNVEACRGVLALLCSKNVARLVARAVNAATAAWR